MRILYFTFMTPSVKFGGGLGVLKSLNALCNIGEVYYIGPNFDQDEVKDYNIRFVGCKYIEMETHSFARIKNMILKGSPSLFVKSWENVINSIDITKFDAIYLERTLQGFVCKWARKTGLPLIVMTHNVEQDFIKRNGPSNNKFVNAFFSWNATKNEKICINNANKVIVLTMQDRQRFIDLYGNDLKYEVMPVCVAKSTGVEVYETDKPYILLTGSLWFGPNADGIIWFLGEVWKQIQEEIDMQVIIAGSNPNQKLLDVAAKFNNVTVIKNPEDMGKYYRGASIFVAPIFEGAGMKVKVAEAMSYGLPVIATEHSVIGYDKGKDVVFVVHSSSDCIEQIKKLYEMGSSQVLEIRRNVVESYERFYSVSTFLNDMNRLFEKTVRSSKESFVTGENR